MARIEGAVQTIDESGSLVTDIRVEALRAVPRDQRTRVVCDEHVTLGLFEPDHQEPPMTYIAILGSAGFLELCIVGDRAADMLGIKSGQPVAVEW